MLDCNGIHVQQDTRTELLSGIKRWTMVAVPATKEINIHGVVVPLCDECYLKSTTPVPLKKLS